VEIIEVLLDDIDDSGRQRSEYGKLDDIQVSVEQHGLYQPITLRKHPDRSSAFIYKLVAGGRRLAAFRNMDNARTIPSIVREDTDDLEALEIEMLENFARKDFTWYERIKIVYAINEAMIKKGATRLESGTASNWGLRKTANLIHKSYGTVQRQLKLYEFCQMIPELKDMENEDRAVKAARLIMEKSVTKGVRERQKAIIDTSEDELVEMAKDNPEELRRLKFINNLTKTADSNYRVGDVFDGLRAMIDLKEKGKSPPIRLCEVDPPYAIDLIEQKKGETKTLKDYNEIDRADYLNFIDDLCQLLYFALPDDCHIVFWHGAEWYDLIRMRLAQAGFNVDKIPCIWTKQAGQTSNPDRYLARAHEQFIYAWKGDPILAKRGRTNVFNFNTVSPTDKRHPTQRPIDLMVEIFETFTFPKQIILIPFLGSGVSLLAAYRHDNLAFGWDLSESYKESFMEAVDYEIQNYYLNANSEGEENE